MSSDQRARADENATTKRRQGAHCTIDFEKNGKQIGFFLLPLSAHDDAWGVIRIPLAVINNGDGRRVIRESGNQGHEYGGPIVVAVMIRDLDPGAGSGRAVVDQADNLPAVRAG